MAVNSQMMHGLSLVSLLGLLIRILFHFREHPPVSHFTQRRKWASEEGGGNGRAGGRTRLNPLKWNLNSQMCGGWRVGEDFSHGRQRVPTVRPTWLRLEVVQASAAATLAANRTERWSSGGFNVPPTHGEGQRRERSHSESPPLSLSNRVSASSFQHQRRPRQRD